ncbi:NAD-dependent histone deacetylase HST3 [Dissostichus eleginoides]|uniref:NAD-dependent histone deacetylase HST3 n=1 Tax=Dissostichus eleginoides TaxID=100907 RepID=A0AAD9FNY4_DISEL|nr:NAD-dependent histone deacetylase HST3 [Dissostichus eleginoides]
MGDAEWLARLKAFANSGVWPSEGGNKPAPRQRKWYDLYQKIEKCPMQARRQTTLFGGSMACNCGFHVVKPANAPQSVASVSAPGATASAQQTFLRPPLSLSMFSLYILCEDLHACSILCQFSLYILCEDLHACSILCQFSLSILCEHCCKHHPGSRLCEYCVYSFNESGGDEPATAAAASFWLPREMSKTIPAVDDSGMAGMDRVDSFAECLVGLRNQLTMVLTNQQVSNIVALWQNLLDYDKQRVVFAARHQSRLDTGRFGSPKKRQEFTPGVESLKRHALTTTAPLAQKIRRPILSNGTVMQQTTLQLVDLSHTTLVQWHNKRVKREDNALVLQGLVLPSRLSVASDPLPPSNVRPQSAAPQPGVAYHYILPSSTVGQAKLKRKASPTTATPATVKLRSQLQLFPAPPFGPQMVRQLFPAPPQLPSGPQMVRQLFPAPRFGPQMVRQLFPAPSSGPQMVLQRQLFPASPLGHCSWIFNPVTSQVPVQVAAPQAPNASLSSVLPAPIPAPTTRKLTRKVEHNTCKKCGKFRTAETGHSQYKGVVYCPLVEALSKEQWLKDMRNKK